MWPAATCLAYMGLKNIGLNEEATRIAGKYVAVVRKVFDETGRL
ncbi:MAG: trehalase family glycosidase [Eubacteriales bacterium]|nr:trehalase family glycosidase [Eubacteriales bacterium]